MPEPCRRRDLGAVALSCLVLRIPAMLSSRWFDPDEAAIAVQARTLVAGGRLYVDMADRKPPIPPFVYAAWFDLTDSNDPRGPRLIVALMLAVAAVALVHEMARTAGRSVALWTGALYVIGCYAFTPHDGAAANYAHFAVPLATLAILACRRGGRLTVVGGLFLGLAILSRQSWVMAVPAGGLSCWMSAQRLPMRLRAVAGYMAGLVAGVAIAGLLAPWSDYWFWNFTSSPGFVFASIGIGTAAAAGIASLGLFIAYHLAAVGAAATRLRDTWRTHLDLWAWVACGVAAWSAGFRFFGHYWMQVVPPLVILAAPALAAAGRVQRRAASATLAITVVVVLVSQMIPAVFRDRPDPGPVAAAIRSCTATDDRVFVWGSFPELLVAVDRPAAGRMVHSDFVTGRSGGRQAATDSVTPGAQDRMMDDLLADPPAVLVDTSGVRHLGYQAFPLQSNSDLAAFAQRSYTPVTVGGYVLWWLHGSPCATHVTGG